MRILTFIYTVWAIFWFVFLFLLLFPFFWIFLQKEKWKPKAHYLNRLWGKMLFPLLGIRIKIQYDFVPDERKAYVFCANHFSYFDIAAMGLVIKNYYAFVGKSDVKRVPLLGYMFAKLHIQVDRADKDSRAKSMTRSIRTLISGRSIMIFPEGGIKSPNFPQMFKPLKDGAFVMAIQQQVPIVPITFLSNYKILHDDEIALRPFPMRAVVHEPISTIGMTQADVTDLKEKTFQVIQSALNKYHGITE